MAGATRRSPAGSWNLAGRTESALLTRLTCQSNINRAETETRPQARRSAAPVARRRHLGVCPAGLQKHGRFRHHRQSRCRPRHLLPLLREQAPDLPGRRLRLPRPGRRNPRPHDRPVRNPDDARHALAADCTDAGSNSSTPTATRPSSSSERPRPSTRASSRAFWNSGRPRWTTSPRASATFATEGSLAPSPHPNSSPAFSWACSTRSINTYVLRETDADLDAIAEHLAAFIWNAIAR